MIRCRDLCVERQGKRILEGISLDLKAGEHWVLWGENGAGKTTLARTLAGFLAPSAGTLSWSEGLNPPLPLLFQDPDAQIAGATVRDELALGAREPGEPPIRRGEPGPAGRRLAQALADFRLDALSRRNPHSLSGGEKRRLNLAALSVLESPVLILDEPELHLDDRARREWTALLDQWIAGGDRCVLEITHEAARARKAQRLAVLREGRLLAAGAVQELQSALGVHGGGSAPRPSALPGALPGGLDERRLLLKAEGLVLRRPGGGTPLLDAANLELRSGERVLLLGENGSGKTSLLILLAGLADPDAGRVTALGARAREPHSVLAFQEPERSCFAETVAEELDFGLRRRCRLSAPERGRRAREALLALGLSPETTLDRDPFQLSAGERRRVALAAVLALAPELLFLDEPAASLDRRGRDRLREALAAFPGALLWSDHREPAGFEGFFDRRLVLAGGRLEEGGWE